MADKLTTHSAQVQQGDLSEVEAHRHEGLKSSEKVMTDSKDQEPEEITALKDKIQKLEQEEQKGKEALKEAEIKYEQAKAQAPAKLADLEDKALGLEERKERGEEVGEELLKAQTELKIAQIRVQQDIDSLENLVKNLEQSPVAKSLEPELQEARAELRQAEKKWQEEIAPSKSAEEAKTISSKSAEEEIKPGAAQLNKEFKELQANYKNLFQRKEVKKTIPGKIQEVLEFQEMSQKFKSDLSKASPEDQKKFANAKAQSLMFDKRSNGLKQGLEERMKNPPKKKAAQAPKKSSLREVLSRASSMLPSRNSGSPTATATPVVKQPDKNSPMR